MLNIAQSSPSNGDLPGIRTRIPQPLTRPPHVAFDNHVDHNLGGKGPTWERPGWMA